MALVTPLLLGACGDKTSENLQAGERLTHEQYQQAIQAILNSEDTRMANRLFTDSVATEHPRAECEKRVRGLHDHLAAIVSQVADLRAPDDADEAQDQFLEGALESVRRVADAAADVRSGRLRCGQDLNGRIYGMPSTKRAEKAIEQLQEKGYVVFGD